MVNLDFNVLVFLMGFVFALPIIGYLFRFNIPISIFFLLAGTFIIAIFLAIDGIILNDRTDSSTISEQVLSNTTVYAYNLESFTATVNNANFTAMQYGQSENPTATSPLIGDQIQCMDVYLSRVGSPTGNLVFGQFGSTGSSPNVQFGSTITAMSISTTPQFYTFCLPETSEVIGTANQRYGFVISGGNSTNYIVAYYNAGNPIANTIRTFLAFGSTTWDNTGMANNDMTMRLYDLSPNTAVIEDFTYQDNVMDFTFTGENFQLKVIMIFISVMFLVGGALVEVRQR